MSTIQSQGRSRLGDLPPELLQPVFNELALSESNNMKDAYSGTEVGQKMSAANEDRHSISRYLSSTFSKADDLLDAMASNQVYISGSRALDYFVPGTATAESDWDFYVAAGPHTVEAFMVFMQSIGVSWETAYDTLAGLFNLEEKDFQATAVASKVAGALASCAVKDPATAARLRFKHSLAYDEDSADAWDLHGMLMRLRYWPDSCLEVSRDGHMVTLKSIGGNVDPYMDKTSIKNVFNGVLRSKGTETRIQLIEEAENPANRNRSFACVFRFHSSCVQAVIGPFSAVHFYYQATSERASYLWPENLMDGDNKAEDIERLKQKYEARGYHYLAVPHSDANVLRRAKVRNACDGEAHLVLYDRKSRHSSKVAESFIADMKDATWYEYDDRTILIEGPASLDTKVAPRRCIYGLSKDRPRARQSFLDMYGIGRDVDLFD